MQLEDYFNFLSPDDIRIKGHRIGIDNVLDYYLEGYTPEEIAANLRFWAYCPQGSGSGVVHLRWCLAFFMCALPLYSIVAQHGVFSPIEKSRPRRTGL